MLEMLFNIYFLTTVCFDGAGKGWEKGAGGHSPAAKIMSSLPVRWGDENENENENQPSSDDKANGQRTRDSGKRKTENSKELKM